MLWRALAVAVTVAVCTGPIGVSAQCAAGSGIGDDGSCALCVRGRYGTGNSCEVCQKGTYDHDGSAATACVLCGAGTYSGAAAFACIPCVAGTHDDDADAATVCVACDNGKYSPAASYTDENTVGCEDCAAGRADLDGPATPCTDCAEGKYSAQGATQCSACAPGQYDHDYTATCVETAAVRWGGISVLADALACAAVTDLSTEAACAAVMQDADATAGACSYIAAVALSARTRCVWCAVGTYAAAGSTSCFRCPAGHHDVDQNPATPCDQDGDLCVSVDSDASADTCLGDGVLDGTTAENEDECEGRGTNECNFLVSSSCPAGTHTDGVFGQIVCTPCDAGTYDHDQAPETACQPCPAGTYADRGQASCTACVAGQVDEDSNPASPCTACGTGKYSPEGETECTDCVAGRADLDTNSATPCDSCGSGQHSDAGVTVCTDCARGTYNDQGPAKECKDCGVGFYSDVAATSCSPGADCVGTWTTCTAACETSAARAFTIITAQAGGGAACPTAAPDCADGDGACIDKDCAGTWTTCTAACEDVAARTWIETTAQAGGGAACPAAVDCVAGDGACLVAALVSAPAHECPDPPNDPYGTWHVTAVGITRRASLTCADGRAGVMTLVGARCPNGLCVSHCFVIGSSAPFWDPPFAQLPHCPKPAGAKPADDTPAYDTSPPPHDKAYWPYVLVLLVLGGVVYVKRDVIVGSSSPAKTETLSSGPAGGDPTIYDMGGDEML